MSAVKEAFYEKYAQAAIDQQIKYGIPASVTLAQMAIESGMGTNTLSTKYNNFFSVKKVVLGMVQLHITWMTISIKNHSEYMAVLQKVLKTILKS